MIKETIVDISLNSKTIKHYWLLGYSGTTGDIIKVKISYLTKGSHVEITAICDKCSVERKIKYKLYLKNFSNGNVYLCHKCCDDKKVLTCLKNYGVNRPLQNKDILNKLQKTNNERYGANHFMLTDDFLNNKEINDKRRQTRINNGNQISDDNYDNWKNYERLVRNETKRKRNITLALWNGYDYYDGDYIKDNFKLYKPNDINYPTIDHKISVKYGFENDIHPMKLCENENLCVTKNKNNCSKGNLNSDKYQEIRNK